MIAGVVAGTGAVGASRRHAEAGFARSEVAPIAVGGGGGDRRGPRGMKTGARHLRRAAGASTASRAVARAATSMSAVAARTRAPRGSRAARASARTRDAPVTRARSAPPRRPAGSSAPRRASLPVTEPRRRPTQTVAVMSRSSDLAAGGDAIVGEPRVRFDRALQRNGGIFGAGRPWRATARSRRSSGPRRVPTSHGRRVEHGDLAEPRRRAAVAHRVGLARLALAVGRRPPQPVRRRPAEAIARRPEVRRPRLVRRVAAPSRRACRW